VFSIQQHYERLRTNLGSEDTNSDLQRVRLQTEERSTPSIRPSTHEYIHTQNHTTHPNIHPPPHIIQSRHRSIHTSIHHQGIYQYTHIHTCLQEIKGRAEICWCQWSL